MCRVPSTYHTKALQNTSVVRIHGLPPKARVGQLMGSCSCGSLTTKMIHGNKVCVTQKKNSLQTQFGVKGLKNLSNMISFSQFPMKTPGMLGRISCPPWWSGPYFPPLLVNCPLLAHQDVGIGRSPKTDGYKEVMRGSLKWKSMIFDIVYIMSQHVSYCIVKSWFVMYHNLEKCGAMYHNVS